MKYFHNTSWLFAERLFKMGVNFFVIIFLTRYLGPENFGLLSYSQSFVAIFIAFATLGLDSILVRELTKNVISSETLLGTAIAMKLLASLLSIAVIFVINVYIEDKEAVLLTNIIAFSLIFQSLNALDTYFQANVISKFSVISNAAAFFVSSLLKLFLIFFDFDLIYFAYALVFDSILIIIGYIYIYMMQKKSLLTLKYDQKLAFYFLKNGWPLMMVAMAAFIYTRTDQVMIKHLLGNEAIGNFAAATKISELFYFIPVIITQSIFPKIIELKERSEDEYFKLLEYLYRLLIWTSVPIALGLLLFSDWIVVLLYGEQYSQTAGILSILAFSIILNAIGTITTKILYAEHYEKKYLYRSILGIFVNIGLNYWLIHIYGAKGAAIATLITLFVIYYVYDLFDKDLHKFYYLKWQCFMPLNLKGNK